MQTQDLIGQQLGNYRLTTLLGRGGFARVYLGEHIFLGSQAKAAIKVLNETKLSTGYHKSVPPLTRGTREDRLRVGGESLCVVPNPLIQLS